jgi:hypothetical protein
MILAVGTVPADILVPHRQIADKLWIEAGSIGYRQGHYFPIAS